MDLISVIVPIYNVESYLDRCIESIVNQTYKNLEIILVDDGSPDNCPAMCDAWAARDSRIQVIHKENGGLSDARNAGLAAASGEYIAFADSDDWVDAQCIRSLYGALRETDSEIAACDVCVTSRETGESCSFTKAPARICTPAEAIGDILKAEVTAANFGNVSELATGEDIARGILNMVLETVGMISVFAARSRGTEDIVLTGNLTELDACRKKFEQFNRMGYGVRFSIPERARFATVIGTALSADEMESVRRRKT